MAVDWITPDELTDMWDTAEGIDPAVIQDMLDAARDACEAYLPAVGDRQRPRDRTIRLAQFTLVRGLWNDAIAGDGGEVGADEFGYNPPWLAREARRMMRPPRAGTSLPTGHNEITPAVTYEPATLTWPNGQALTMTREGDIVTAEIRISGIPTMDATLMPWPAAYFRPRGDASMYLDPNNTYLLTISDGALGVDGIQFFANGTVAPWADGTVQWLADPAVS